MTNTRREAPHREKWARRALRARGGGSEIQNPKFFGGRIFWILNPRVFAPPSRAHTESFAGGSETSEAPFAQKQNRSNRRGACSSGNT